jgi:hypothetical protein
MSVKENRPITEWMEVFSDIYSEQDSTRQPEQIWIAVMHYSSSIGESIRRVAFESLLSAAAHTFCWLCSFVNRCKTLKDDIFSIHETVCGIVSLKYPGVCGHCKQKPCQCDPVKMDKERDKAAEYRDLFDRRSRILASFQGYSIDDARKMFDEIYSGRTHLQTLENIGFHFLEEIGEAAFSIRNLSQLRKITDAGITGIDLDFLRQLSTVEGIVENYMKYSKKRKDIDKKTYYTSKEPDILKARIVESKMGLLIEMGDSFSWFCAILNKLNSIAMSLFDDPKKHPDIIMPLDKVLINEYFDPNTGNARCPTCERKPCECLFYNVVDGLTTEITTDGRKRV